MASIKPTLTITRDNKTLINHQPSARTTTGTNFQFEEITVLTSEVTYDIKADIGNAREMIVRNLDGTNFVDFGFATGVYPIRIRANSAIFIELDPAEAQLFLKADTATCAVEVFVHEE